MESTLHRMFFNNFLKNTFVRNALANQTFKGYQFCTAANNEIKVSTKESSANSEVEVSVPKKDRLYSRLEVEVKGSDPAVLKSYSWFATTAASHLGIEVGKSWAQRKPVHDRLTLLKSVHIYKKHRVQYEVRTYFRFMHFNKLTESTLSTFLEYIERNLPEGVALKATKIELQKLPEHLQTAPEAV